MAQASAQRMRRVVPFALTTLARQAGHPELAGAPWVSSGMSAGAQVSYEMTAWQPERT